MSSTNQTAKKLHEVIQQAAKQNKSGYDTPAEVVRVDGETAWVHIPGGVDETPAKLTINAKPGDMVQVGISGGRATLTGNASAPPTDDTEAYNAMSQASTAAKAASIAQEKAEEAITDAARAHAAADEAEAHAAAAQEAAEDAQEAAEDAADAASEAQTSATAANTAANNALMGLGTVESVLDVVNWFAEHKTPTTDTTVNPSKAYYSYDSTTGTLTKVDPDGTENPSTEGWYELDEAISNYVATHLALTNEGLSVVGAANGWRVVIAAGGGTLFPNAGIYLVDPNGNIAQTTNANGVSFNTGRPITIGDSTASIVFDGNGGITMIGANVTIGGANNVSGALKVLDANGNVIGTWNNNGLYAKTAGGALNVTSWGNIFIEKSTNAVPLIITSSDCQLDLDAHSLWFRVDGYNYNFVDINAFESNYGGFFQLTSKYDSANGITFRASASSTAATDYPVISLRGTTSPQIQFWNNDASEHISLVFNTSDTIAAPSSLTLNGNQGGEWFIAPKIKATTGMYDLSGNSLFNGLYAKGAFTGDLDATDIEVGIYQIGAANSATNVPSGFTYGNFIQLPYYYAQILVNSNSLRFRTRTGTPAVWNAWRSVSYT